MIWWVLKLIPFGAILRIGVFVGALCYLGVF